MEQIDTANGVYPALKQHVLALKKDCTQDGPLIRELCLLLKCTHEELHACPEGYFSTDTLMHALIQLSAPFAKMFEEIWEYLDSSLADKAKSGVKLRFGYSKKSSLTFSLEKYHQYKQRIQCVYQTLYSEKWPPQAIAHLYYLGYRLSSSLVEPASVQTCNSVRPLSCPQNVTGNDQYTRIIMRIRAVFENHIALYVSPVKETSFASIEKMEEDIQAKIRARQLSDLLPCWNDIFNHHNPLPDAEMAHAVAYFNSHILPLLPHSAPAAVLQAGELLDVLSLPLWRYRWHIADVWVKVSVLKMLERYQPVLNTSGEHIPLDGFSPARVAKLKGHPAADACIMTERKNIAGNTETTYVPSDIRIYTGNAPDSPHADSVIVISSQRARTGVRSDDTDIIQAGCGSVAAQTIVISFGNTLSEGMPGPQPCSFYSISPLSHGTIGEAGVFVKKLMEKTLMLYSGSEAVVLLDVSSSMKNMYENADFQACFQRLNRNNKIRILMFNNGLVKGNSLDHTLSFTPATTGTTNLGSALEQLREICYSPAKLLVITDGGHEHPTQLNFFANVRQIRPDRLADFEQWIIS